MTESWKTRDCSWAPTTATVKVDSKGIQGYGKVMMLVKRPSPTITEDCFRFEDIPLPDTLEEGTLLVENLYLSMDPTHLIWMQEIEQYMPAVGLNTVMRCLGLARVVKTTDAKFPVGTIISGMVGIAEYAVMDFAGCNPIVTDVPVSWNLGPFSLLMGHTAWVGYKICDVKPGETMLVSGATGAVGSIAAQLGKIAGARVIGIAGGTAKCEYAVNVMGLDGCIDYKTEKVADGIKRLCPNGIDSFFDNVGGETLEAAISNMNCFGRIAFCGAISNYVGKMGNSASGPKNFEMILMRRLTVQGFVCVDHLASVGEAFAEIGDGLKSGKIKVKEDIKEGDVTDYVKTINLLFSSGNDGKLILKLPKA